MSYFDEQMDAWLENDCKGKIEDYDPFDEASWPQEKKPYTPPANKVTTGSYGRSRSLLALSKLEEFAAWAVADGFVREPTKGEYEVLRLRWAEKINGQKMQPYIFFQRAGATHATSQAEGTQLVSRWLRSLKQK